MSRDQRPGTIRVFIDPKVSPHRNRRHGDLRKAIAAASPAPASARRWWLVPAWLFGLGFAVGGLATLGRELLSWAGW